MTSEWKTYARALSRQLQCPRAKKQSLLEDTRRLAEDYLAENPGGGYDGLTAFLGSPEELARSYQDAMGPETAKQYRRQRQGLIGLVLGLIILFLIATIWYNIELRSRQHDVHITGEKAIIVYETEEGEN
ncbi:hypothetical protein [Intestinimonas timonensis]|uniref:hypothetical protein n=1 Tax=Intestinimonas timonensis TaxID=1689270 RepID=UPI00102F822C|nr:hypothetical protein [Intestinimonas timonensis]